MQQISWPPNPDFLVRGRRLLLLGALAFAGCAYGGSFSGSRGSDAQAPDGEGSDGAGAGAGESDGGAGEGSTSAGIAPGASTTAGRGAAGSGNLPIRHLLKREVLASYVSLLGNDTVSAASASALLSDETGGGSESANIFDNDVSVQSMSAPRLNGYMTAAQAVSEAALASARLEATLGCPANAITQACIQNFLKTFGRRAFRRPLTADELSQYSALFATETDPSMGARVMLRALLAAPAFLYQPEIGTQQGAPQGYVRLTSYELASKMSFMLLGTTPSAALLDQAGTGGLVNANDRLVAAQQMLQQPAGKAYLRNFAYNWLGIGDAASNGLTQSPYDTAQLHADMPEETLRLFDDFASPGAHLADMYAAPYTYVTPSLAQVYGLPMPANGTWAKTNLSGKPRLGFLSHAAVLNVTGIAKYPSIVRGKYVLERLLCRSAGTPPANAASVVINPNALGGTEREQLASHLSNPSCQGCHNIIDPVGFGFEQYDPAGNFKTSDSKGRALTGEGALPDAANFTGVPSLAQMLANSPAAQHCTAEKLAQYLLGRRLIDADGAVVAQLEADLGNKDLPTAVIDFIASDAFATRKIN